MTENGDPLENAIAERMNGILKEEYLKHDKPEDKNRLKTCWIRLSNFTMNIGHT